MIWKDFSGKGRTFICTRVSPQNPGPLWHDVTSACNPSAGFPSSVQLLATNSGSLQWEGVMVSSLKGNLTG